ncbi:MAG: hypothetical protein WBE76_17185 [Terracidiphilus sp.]
MATWLKLFGKSSNRPNVQDNREAEVEDSQSNNLILTATGEDNEEWLRHLASRNPTHRRAGSSINEEYQAWLLKRAKSRATQQGALERALR